MGKFEVCLRGKNFHIREEGKIIKRNFLAARFVEAADPTQAVAEAVDMLREELRDSVVNPSSDQPKLDVVDVSEVYYFQENMVVESLDNMVVPGKGFLWEDMEEAAAASPVDRLQRRLPSLGERLRSGDIHIHAILIHFTNALFPAALLFLFLYLFTGSDSFRTSYFYLMALGTLSAPLSYITGIFEWKRRFQGVVIEVFSSKIKYGLAVFVLGAAATLWYYFQPGVLTEGGLLAIPFVILNAAILVPLVYLGHLGGVIVYEGLD